MNANELKTTLNSIREHMTDIENQHIEAVEAGNWEKVEILGDTFESLANREYDIEQRIKYAGTNNTGWSADIEHFQG